MPKKIVFQTDPTLISNQSPIDSIEFVKQMAYQLLLHLMYSSYNTRPNQKPERLRLQLSNVH